MSFSQYTWTSTLQMPLFSSDHNNLLSFNFFCWQESRSIEKDFAVSPSKQNVLSQGLRQRKNIFFLFFFFRQSLSIFNGKRTLLRWKQFVPRAAMRDLQSKSLVTLVFDQNDNEKMMKSRSKRRHNCFVFEIYFVKTTNSTHTDRTTNVNKLTRSICFVSSQQIQPRINEQNDTKPN